MTTEEHNLYELHPTANFKKACAKLLGSDDVRSLADRLAQNPQTGLPLVSGVHSVMQMRHPSDKERCAVILYCIDEPTRRVVLIDAVQDGPKLKAWIDDPNNASLIAKYGKAFVRIITEFLLDAS